jgi:hypothetical protein
MYVPAATDGLVINSSVETPDPLIDDGVKLVLTPLGSPVTLSVTDPEKLLYGETVAL